jgi:hypothetical protein
VVLLCIFNSKKKRTGAYRVLMLVTLAPLISGLLDDVPAC